MSPPPCSFERVHLRALFTLFAMNEMATIANLKMRIKTDDTVNTEHTDLHNKQCTTLRKLNYTLALIVSTFTLYADADLVGPMHDVMNFEIAGVKIGTEASELINTLKNANNIDDNSIDIKRREGKVSSVAYDAEEFSFYASFQMAMASDGSAKNIAYYIIQRPFNTTSDEIIKELVEKYGQFTEAGESDGHWYRAWCTRKSEFRDSCDFNEAIFSYSTSGKQIRLIRFQENL